MDIKRYITREDFLTIPQESVFIVKGIVLNGRTYSLLNGELWAPENQLARLGEIDKTGEGIVDKVFFFEVLRDLQTGEVMHSMISAEIVEHYKYVSDQECQKELALVQAKIKLYNKDKEK